MSTNHKRRARRGFSALELAISTSALMLTAGMTVVAIDKLQKIADDTTTSTRLQEEAERAMARTVTVLQRSGFATVGGKVYPHIFVDGDAGTGFDTHDHAAPASFDVLVGGVLEPTFNREIVILQPLDADVPGQTGYGKPDVDGNGELAWDPLEWSLVVMPVAADRNELQLRVDGENPETIAIDVESFLCTDAAIGGAVVPVNSVQVELTLRGRDEQGQVLRYTTRALVRLRNG